MPLRRPRTIVRLIALTAFAAAAPLAVPAALREARADLIAPNSRAIPYSFTVVNTSAHPDWVILAYPVDRAPVVVTYQPVAARVEQSTKLYAMKKEDFAPLRLDALKPQEMSALFNLSKVLTANITIDTLPRVSNGSPLQEVRDVVTIEKLDGKVFEAKIKVVYTLEGGATQEIAYPADGKRPEPLLQGAAPAPTSPAPAPAPASTGPSDAPPWSEPEPGAGAAEGPAPVASAKATPKPRSVEPSSRGCGCDMTAATGSAYFGLAAGAALLWHARRRRSPRR